MPRECVLSRVQLFATPWTAARQAPLSMGFFRQEYESGLSCPPPGNLPNPGIESGCPAWQADSLPSEPPRKLWRWTVRRGAGHSRGLDLVIGHQALFMVVVTCARHPVLG